MGADYSDIKGMWTGSETGVVHIDINPTLFRLWFVSVLGTRPRTDIFRRKRAVFTLGQASVG